MSRFTQALAALFVALATCPAALSAEKNVRDYGAKGDGVSDDYAAIKAAVVAAEAEGGGSVYFPRGTYVMARHDQYSGIWLSQDKPLRFRGDGVGVSAIKMAPGAYAGDFYLFRVESDFVEFANLTLDGNRVNIPASDEQTHLIQLKSTRHFLARNVEFKNARGDGIKIVGETTALVDDLVIDGCTFRDNGRSGITAQRAFHNTHFTNNYFVGTSDQSIDFEPTGNGAPYTVVVTGNIIEHTTLTQAVTICGISDADRVHDVLFANNIVTGGSLMMIDTRNVVVSGNRIAASPGMRAVNVARGHDGLVIANNILTAQGALGVGLYLAAGNGRQPVGVGVTGNVITVAGSNGIVVEGVSGLVVSGNRVIDAGNLGGNGLNMRGTAATLPMQDVVVVGNQFLGFAVGVVIAASPANVQDVIVSGNEFAHRGVGNKTGVEVHIGSAGFMATGVTIGPNHYGQGVTHPVIGYNPATVPEPAVTGFAP